SIFNIFPKGQLNEELMMFILLPPLLFEAAWNLKLNQLNHFRGVIGLLAGAGLLVSVGMIGLILHLTLGLPFITTFLFGAMISATDPVSVIAIFKELRIDSKLYTLVEGESLYNDGTAVVVFKILLAIALISLAGEPTLPLGELVAQGLFQFLAVVLGGMAIGGIIGLLSAWVTQKFEDAMLELTFSVLVAYGAFLVADFIVVPGFIPNIHLSGVLATVTAGLTLGSLSQISGSQTQGARASTGIGKPMAASTRWVITTFWEFAAFVVNSLIFLLIGLEIKISFLISQWQPIAWAIVAVLVARSLAVYGLVPLSNRLFYRQNKGEEIPFSWQHILVWGGLRGALSMVLVLSLPSELPHRSVLIAMVFGVVLFSLLAQGLSIKPLLKKLGLSLEKSKAYQTYESLITKRYLQKGALQQIQQLAITGEIVQPVAESLEAEINQALHHIDAQIEDLHLADETLQAEALFQGRLQMVGLQKEILLELLKHGSVSEAVGERLRLELDTLLENLQGTRVEGDTP
ncbi:MAG: sodium:proton antiporter, partial [Cyanobacteria bacterium]|nr:sodium:proton antiporter [Cyanobacteriota bacterium]